MSIANPIKVFHVGKVTTNVRLNIRKEPNRMSAISSTANTGLQLAYDGHTTEGENISGNAKWYFTHEGNWFWSGGVELLTNNITWGLEKLKVKSLWEDNMGDNVKIAVLDSGIDVNHPDLHGAIANVKNIIKNNEDVNDNIGHGTHCAGIISAQGIKIFGTAPKAKLYVGKIIDRGIPLIEENLINGIEWAIQQKVNIISMSLTLPNSTDKLYEKIKNAFDNNIIMVAAAGNEGQLGYPIDNYPASYKECLSIGSIDSNLRRSITSSESNDLDLLAPGEQILSTIPHGEYKIDSGSSMAAPFVSGIIAIFISFLIRKKQEINGSRIIENIKETATDYGTIGFDIESGFGIINPLNAFKKIKEII